MIILNDICAKFDEKQTCRLLTMYCQVPNLRWKGTNLCTYSEDTNMAPSYTVPVLKVIVFSRLCHDLSTTGPNDCVQGLYRTVYWGINRQYELAFTFIINSVWSKHADWENTIYTIMLVYPHYTSSLVRAVMCYKKNMHQ